MKSGNQIRDKSHSSSAKALQAADPGTPSTALQGATLAFNSCATSANSSRSKHSGINGALAAASFAGGGRKRVIRRTTFETIPASDLKRPVGDSGIGQIGQQVSASNGPIKRTAPSLSREQSPSHIPAVMAATSSSPMPESLGLPRSNPRRPSPLQRAHSELSIQGRLTDVTPIAATNALIQLDERGKTRSRTPSFHEAHRVRSPAPSLASPTPIRPLSGRLSLQSTMPPDPPKPPTRKRGSTTLVNTNSSLVGAHAAARIAARPVQPLAVRSQTPVSLKGPAPKPPPIRGHPKRPALPLERDNTMSSSPDRSTASSSESSYTSAVDKFPSPLKELPRRREPRSASESISTSSALARPSIRPQRLSYEPERKPLFTREPTLSTTSLIPQLTADSLANAMVASSLASSRAPSPTKPHLPPPHRHGKPHHLFHRTKSSDHISRTPSPAKQMKQTLRPSKTYEEEEILHKKGRSHIIRKHPNKHHEGDRKRWRDTVSEAERKRYEGLWAANKNLLLPPRDPPSHTVCNIVVRDIWRRSRLPDDVLAEVWELVDTRQVGDLEKEGFVVGMWLIDQRLKGRKLPVRVSESVWGSVRMLSGIKVHRHRR